MKLSLRLLLLVLFGLSLSDGASRAQQALGGYAPYECDAAKGEEVKATGASSPYKICIEYPKDEPRIGVQGVDLNVIIVSPGGKPLELVSEPEVIAKYEQGVIKIYRKGDMWAEGAGVVKYTYPFRVDISDKAEARGYAIKLKFKYKDESRFPEGDFSLKVYGGGGIKIANKPENVTGMTGEEQHVNLEIENKYREYAVNLKRITITSTPSGLVKYVELQRKVRLEPLSEPQTLYDLTFNIKPMEKKDWLYGFDSKATLDFQFDYEDDQGHNFYSKDKLALVVRPSILILAISIFAGVLAGTAFKFDLQRLKSEGYINSRQMAFFIMSTVVLGIIVSLVALLGRVNISVFEFNGSYDSPKVLFLISFAATMIGPPLLQGLFNKSPRSGAEPGGEQKPAARTGENTTP